MQSNKKNFKEQKIYIGIDVHAKTWQVAVMLESGYTKIYAQPASAQMLFNFLSNHFPGGEYYAVYESGFSGFSTYYALTELGINCKVVHAADVPTTQYESVMKTDKIDAVKLARGLRTDELRTIYIRDKETLDDRSVFRIRTTIQKDLARYKNRIKHMLYSNGIEIPDRYLKPGSNWSRAFMEWLKNDVKLLSSTRNSLNMLIKQVETIRQALLEATRTIRKMSEKECYRENYKLLRTIPDVGHLTSMCLLTEIYDFSRFHNEKQFASFMGLVPTCHDSGEKVVVGEKTFRGNRQLGVMIIEACWVAIYRDYALGMAYASYKQHMKPQKAIVKIARKMSNIIFFVLKNGKEYEPYKWEE